VTDYFIFYNGENECGGGLGQMDPFTNWALFEQIFRYLSF